MASITVRPLLGRNTRASRLCMPQSSPLDPFSRYGSVRGGTDGANRSLSAMTPPSASVTGRSRPSGSRRRARARGPPQRVEQAVLGKLEQPRVDLPPPGVAVVVDGDGRGLRLERGRALAQRGLEFGQAGVDPRAPAGAQGRA